MFIGRNEEIKKLTAELTQWDHRSAVLVYGKRRVGKSTLIAKVAASFNGIVVNHLCVTSTFDGNLELIYNSISEALCIPRIRFDSIFAMMDYLKTTEKKILLIIDEYPYLKQTRKKGEVDSVFQSVIDRMPANVKLILCGSYITVMKELLEEDNPLFGRFSLIQHIRDFDYYDASCFYPQKTPAEKAALYAVFGGSPYVLSNIDVSKSVRENVIAHLLPETGLVRSHIENVMLKEIQKTFDSRILEAIGNGKKRYTDIRGWISTSETGLLDKQLKILLDMETIQKTQPINRRSDKKKQFYEITDNLMRFYFTFLFGKTGTISRIGEAQFFVKNIEGVIDQFISRRLEGVAREYFHRMAVSGIMTDIEDYGCYWYDDPVNNKNGEFDVVLDRGNGTFDFYECKYFDRKMTIDECRMEEDQLRAIQGIDVSGIGFVCTGGFEFGREAGYDLIDGEALFAKTL